MMGIATGEENKRRETNTVVEPSIDSMTVG
jgi:hypothetical protein